MLASVGVMPLSVALRCLLMTDIEAHAEAPVDQPQPHPASPTHSLPDSFVAYRSKAQQHGPLSRRSPESSDAATSAPINPSRSLGRSGHDLGSVEPGPGQYFHQDELPARFHSAPWRPEEIEAIELGGANLDVGWAGA